MRCSQDLDKNNALLVIISLKIMLMNSHGDSGEVASSDHGDVRIEVVGYMTTPKI